MNHPLDIFQRVYVINLPDREDRRRDMGDQLRQIGLSYEAENVELFSAVRPDSKGRFPTIGAHGCFLSHLGVLKKASAKGLQTILILEDDLNFSPRFNQLMAVVARRLKEHDWSIFYGGYRVDRVPDADAFMCGSLPPDEAVETAHFFGVSGTTIASLVQYLEAQLTRPPGDPAGGPMHVDGSYSWFRRSRPELLTLLAVPELGHQRASRSDIHVLRWYDRLFAIRTAVALLRRVRND